MTYLDFSYHKCRIGSDDAFFWCFNQAKITPNIKMNQFSHQVPMPYGQKFGARWGEERRNLLCPPPPNKFGWQKSSFSGVDKPYLKSFLWQASSFLSGSGIFIVFLLIFVGRKKLWKGVCPYRPSIYRIQPSFNFLDFKELQAWMLDQTTKKSRQTRNR